MPFFLNIILCIFELGLSDDNYDDNDDDDNNIINNNSNNNINKIMMNEMPILYASCMPYNVATCTLMSKDSADKRARIFIDGLVVCNDLHLQVTMISLRYSHHVSSPTDQ